MSPAAAGGNGCGANPSTFIYAVMSFGMWAWRIYRLRGLGSGIEGDMSSDVKLKAKQSEQDLFKALSPVYFNINLPSHIHTGLTKQP